MAAIPIPDWSRSERRFDKSADVTGDCSRMSDLRRSLLRIFGLGFGLAVVIGGVVGSGIMRNPSVVANGFPDATWILLAWLGGGLFVMIDAMPTVELGAAIPLAGGGYSIVGRAIGPRAGFLVGWCTCAQLII